MIIAPPLAIVLWLVSALLWGVLVATFDVTRGHYKQLAWGLTPATPYNQLLHDRYGIEYKSLGCGISPELVGYVVGYNAVSMPAAKWKYGHDVFAESREEAKKIWKRCSTC